MTPNFFVQSHGDMGAIDFDVVHIGREVILRRCPAHHAVALAINRRNGLGDGRVEPL